MTSKPTEQLTRSEQQTKPVKRWDRKARGKRMTRKTRGKGSEHERMHNIPRRVRGVMMDEAVKIHEME